MPPFSTILHLDLDCFYAQVERERLRLPSSAALVVIQWSMALAVTYPARALGIKRGMHLDEIRRRADPSVTIVHVETIGGSHSDTTATIAPDAPNTQKVSLARYRTASARVFEAMNAVLARCGAVLERASIDEAYIDVTLEADRRARGGRELTEMKGMVIVGDKVDMGNASDLRLMHGAAIAAELRQRVLRDCRYTVSAGVSVNKLLAKFASARNKPDGQTVVPMVAVEALISDVPLRKLRGLGGKLGREVEEMGVITAGEARKLSLEELERRVGNKFGRFVYDSVRGVDDSEVRERDKTKSLLAAKSFPKAMTLEPVERKWFPILAEELAERVGVESELHNREARTLVVSFRVRHTGGAREMVSGSRSAEMPLGGVEGRAEAILRVGMAVLRKVMKEEKQYGFPINFVGLTGTNFLDRANANESISRYFTAGEGKREDEEKEGGKLVRDSLEEHQRRLQESKDREMALRLHREESLRSLGKVIQKPGAKQGGKKKRDAGGLATLDRFVFGKKGNKS